MAISGDLEALKSTNFLTRRQPWWRLVRFGPPNIRNVPMPLIIRIRNVTIRVIKNSIKKTWFSCVHVGKIFGLLVFHSEIFLSAPPQL